MEQERCPKFRNDKRHRRIKPFRYNGCAGCRHYNHRSNECKFPFKELAIININSQAEKTDMNDKKDLIINNRVLLISVFITSFALTYIWALFVYWRD